MGNKASLPKMYGTPPISLETREQIEQEMRRIIRQRQAEWQGAPEETRDIAQQRFLKALHLFTAFILDGKLPDDSEV